MLCMQRKVQVWAFIGLLVTMVLVSCSSSAAVDQDRIDLLETVIIGGMEQFISVRGDNPDNPVLLWLHGGPGATQMPVAHKYDKELEKAFIVVHWDQRGAGKSNRRNFDESTMTVDRFVRDCHELTLYLKEKFGREKIYLLGHSWGAQLGIMTVASFPEDYSVYIGLGQVINALKAHVTGHEWLEGRIEESGNNRDLEKLKILGEAPYPVHSDFVEFIQMVSKYGGGFDVSFGILARTALSSPYYSLADMKRWLDGSNRGSGPMWEETIEFNALTDIPGLEVPVCFISGSEDYNTPKILVEEYYNELQAPLGKKFVVIEGAAHTPCFSSPEQFARELVKIKDEIEMTGGFF